VLETGDRNLIRWNMEDLVRGVLRQRARFLLGSDNSVYTRISLDDYRFAIEVYRENANYGA